MAPKLVDRHRPSKACAPCREKRSRCDRKKPSCMQCIRASRVCHSYRNDGDLFIVAYKSPSPSQERTPTPEQKTTKKISPICQTAAVLELASSRTRASQSKNYCVKPVLTQPAQDIAVGFLFARLSSSIFAEYVPYLFRSTSINSALHLSATALALRYYAGSLRSASMEREAQRTYSKALTALQKTIQNNITAAADEVLASTLLLAQYEPFADTNSGTWSVHIQGALALIDQRVSKSSPSLLRHETQIMAVQAMSLVEVDCLVNSKRFPRNLPAIFKSSSEATNQNANTFFSIAQAAMNLRCELTTSSCSLSQIILAQALDQQAAQLVQAIPSEDFIRLLSQRSEVRRRVNTAHTLLMVRAVLNDMILDITDRLLLDGSGYDLCELVMYADEAQHSLTSINQCIYEIVPPFLWTEEFRAGSDDLDIWVCSLIWPFSYQLSLKHLPEKLRIRARSQLLQLADLATHPSLKKVIENILEGRGEQDISYMLYLC